MFCASHRRHYKYSFFSERQEMPWNTLLRSILNPSMNKSDIMDKPYLFQQLSINTAPIVDVGLPHERAGKSEQSNATTRQYVCETI